MSARTAFEDIVVGAGSAGCVVAGRSAHAIPRANTNLTTIALAERIAHRTTED